MIAPQSSPGIAATADLPAKAHGPAGPTDTQPERRLLPLHRKMLEDGSGIHPDVIAERGYFSCETWRELQEWRQLLPMPFKQSQNRAECYPALLIPMHGPKGELTHHVLRYDYPRIDKKGKAIKYEQPANVGPHVDFPLRCVQGAWDPSQTLWFTEGAKKADCLASRGVVAVNMPGVDAWHTPTSLPDLLGIPLKERSVVIAYDSDVMTKDAVRKATRTLGQWAQHKKADVNVIDWTKADLPEGFKTGVDDFLTGHSLDELMELLISFEEWLESIKPKEGDRSCPYRPTAAGLEWLKPDKQKLGNPEPVLLTNFAAKITADIAENDGAETRRIFEIQSYLKERSRTFRVPAEKFGTMNWVTEHLGAGAIVYPGNGTKDHARAAIQLLSGDVPEREVFTHLGWRQIGDKWFYLHAGGAIGEDGAVDGVDVSIASSLANYELPAPPTGEDLILGIRQSLELLDLAPKGVTVPLFAASYRAVTGGVNHSIHLFGETGTGKSVLAALIQQHFGRNMDGGKLPGSWMSTGNALETMAFLAKDAVLVVDDFVPSGSSADVAKLNREAERLLRGQGNQAGRQRLTVDGTLRQGRPPRGLVLSTGEDIPRGQSLRARLLILELEKGALNWSAVSLCQNRAARGVYAGVLAAFIQWMAPRYAQVQSALPSRIAELRSAAYKSSLHRRVPEIVANLSAGLSYFLQFGHECGALTPEESEQLWAAWWQALSEPAAKQARHQAAIEPARRFLILLGSVLASGKSHLTSADGDVPEQNPEAWGWKRHSTLIAGESISEWQPQGPKVGWVDGEAGDPDLYLDPETSIAAAQELGNKQGGEALLVSPQTLRKRLKDQHFLASVDASRETITVRRQHLGRAYSVLHLKLSALSTSEIPDIPDKSTASGPPPWRTASDPLEMSGIGTGMSGEMSGFSASSEAPGSKNGYPGIPRVREDSLPSISSLGNVGNVGFSLPIPSSAVVLKGIVSPAQDGDSDIGAAKPDIFPFPESDNGAFSIDVAQDRGGREQEGLAYEDDQEDG